MWSDVLLSDKDSLQKIYDILITIHPGYMEFTPDEIISIGNKKRLSQFKCFLYEDKDYELCLMGFVDPGGRLRIITGGPGKFLDIQTAADLINKKILQTITDLGVKYAWAVRVSNGSPFYEQFYSLMTNIGILSGFFDAKTTDNYKSETKKAMEFFIAAPDGSYDPIVTVASVV
jgi:hypothetical protein